MPMAIVTKMARTLLTSLATGDPNKPTEKRRRSLRNANKSRTCVGNLGRSVEHNTTQATWHPPNNGSAHCTQPLQNTWDSFGLQFFYVWSSNKALQPNPPSLFLKSCLILVLFALSMRLKRSLIGVGLKIPFIAAARHQVPVATTVQLNRCFARRCWGLWRTQLMGRAPGRRAHLAGCNWVERTRRR